LTCNAIYVNYVKVELNLIAFRIFRARC
jgi:hypothetical protein